MFQSCNSGRNWLHYYPQLQSKDSTLPQKYNPKESQRIHLLFHDDWHQSLAFEENTCCFPRNAIILGKREIVGNKQVLNSIVPICGGEEKRSIGMVVIIIYFHSSILLWFLVMCCLSALLSFTGAVTNLVMNAQSIKNIEMQQRSKKYSERPLPLFHTAFFSSFNAWPREECRRVCCTLSRATQWTSDTWRRQPKAFFHYEWWWQRTALALLEAS